MTTLAPARTGLAPARTSSGASLPMVQPLRRDLAAGVWVIMATFKRGTALLGYPELVPGRTNSTGSKGLRGT